jgi:shikimate kinase
MNLLLIGYRGTGKSTVGRLVAESLGLAFTDADAELEKRAGRSIREIFATDGEQAFRDLEAVVVAELCQRNNMVVALGGGAVLRAENRAVIRSRGKRTVWLKAPPAVLFERIAADASTAQRRPNLTTAGGLAEVESLLAARTPYYEECADFTVDTEGKTAEQVAAEVVSLVRSVAS